MSREELILKLKELAGPPCDPEVVHGDADDALLAYINDSEITAAFEAIERWYA